MLGREIGQEKFGSVRVCWSKASGKVFACKMLRKNGKETMHQGGDHAAPLGAPECRDPESYV